MNLNELRKAVDEVMSVASVRGEVISMKAIKPLYLLALDVIRGEYVKKNEVVLDEKILRETVKQNSTPYISKSEE